MHTSSVKTTYRNYLNTSVGANIYNSFIRLIYSNSDTLVTFLEQDIINNLSLARQQRLRVCDVGGGDGRRISAILRSLNRHYGHEFDLDFVEQSKVYTEDFSKNPVGSFCRTMIYLTMFEQLELQKSAYDLLFLIHSIFAFENGSVVDKILSLRKPSGKVIIISNTDDSFLGGLKTIVDEGFSDSRYELNELEISLSEKGASYSKLPFKTKFSLNDNVLGHDIGCFSPKVPNVSRRFSEAA